MKIICNEPGLIKIQNYDLILIVMQPQNNDPQYDNAMLVQVEEVIETNRGERAISSAISVLPRANNSILVKVAK